jgi:hypothetical protein
VELEEQQEPRSDHSFVAVLWLESSENGEFEWRWKVRCMQSGRQKYFRKIDQLLEFVGKEAGVAPPT